MDWWNNYAAIQDDPNKWWSRSQAPQPQPQGQQPDQNDAGFFGNIGQGAANLVQGVGGFFGDMVNTIADDAAKAVGGIVKVAGGEAEKGKLEANTKELNDLNKKRQAYMNTLSDTDYDRPDVKEKLAEFQRRANDLSGKGQAITKGEAWKASQSVDPVETAAAAANTALSVGTLGATGLIKGGVRQGAKLIGKELFTNAAEKAAPKFAANTAAGAARKIGAGALEGGSLGAAYGALAPLSDQGSDANINDIWQGALMGGALGGTLGGAVPLLSKDVRAGVREIPGQVRQGANAVGEQVNNLRPSVIAAKDPRVIGYDDQYADLQRAYDNATDQTAKQRFSQAMAQNRLERGQTMRSIMEGGYIRIPGGGAIDDAAEGADLARRQLGGEDINAPKTMEQNYIDEQVASHSSPDDFLNKTVDDIWARNKKGQGTDSTLVYGDPGSYDVTGRITVSNNNRFYSDFYRENGRKPTKGDIRDMVENELTGKPLERVNSNLLATSDQMSPVDADIYRQLQDREAGMQATMQAGPGPDLYQQYANDLGQPGAQNAAPAIPRPVSAAQGEKVGTGSFGEPKPLTQAPTNPYEGMAQNLDTPALPQGELPKPLTVAGARREFTKTGEAPEFVNQQKSGSKPIELPATVEEGGNVALRQTKGGKLVPFKYLSKDDIDALGAISADDTGSRFTMTRTPDMNLEEALAGRGGAQSKEFQTLSKFNTDLREHTAQYTDEVQGRRDFLEKFIDEFGIDGKKAHAMRPYLEAADDKASKEAIDAYRKDFGDKAADGLIRLRNWWRAEKDIVLNETNAVIEKYAGKDRMMGDLGATYVPRVYKQGPGGFNDSVLDIAHAGMDAIGGKNGLFNLRNDGGYLSKESENMGGVLRNSEGIPLNSEFTRPNTTYLSAAQKRTANAPVGKLEDPITSMMRYFEATGRAKHLTPDIAKGQEMRKAIEMINNDTGNMRQVDKAFEDQINSIAGKTSRIDRPAVDNKTGNILVNIATKVQSRIARSTILGSVNSALAQTGQLPLIAVETGEKNFAAGLQDIIRGISKTGDDPMAQSALMKTRYPKYENMFKVTKGGRAGNKGTNIVAKPFRLIEHSASELAWRSSYRKALESGLEGKAAIQEADRIAAKIIGERSPGARAALYESKALGPITSYTLEVNQLYQVAKQYFKRDPAKAAKLVGAIWLYNQAYSAITGNKLNADPAAAALDAGKLLTDQNFVDENGQPIGLGERLVRAGGRLAGEAIDATPLGGPVVGQLYPENGFRIPFGGGDRALSREDIFGGTNIGRYGGGTPIASGLSNPLLLLGIPGMAQLQRSVEGANVVNNGASVTGGGNTRFDVQNTPEEMWRAILFGQYGTQAGRDYLRQQNNSLAGYNQQ